MPAMASSASKNNILEKQRMATPLLALVRKS
jgi:hypothetical protein